MDKSNLLAGCKLFRESFDKVATDFKGVSKDYAYVDAWTLLALRKPEFYDVVVAPNAFGDIISDLGGAIQGGLGVAPSGNIGEKHGMFEPVHGSAPDIAGTGQANPIAAVLSVAMMFEWLGTKNNDKASIEAAHIVRRAVESVLNEGQIRTIDLCLGRWEHVKPATTLEVGVAIIKRMAR